MASSSSGPDPSMETAACFRRVQQSQYYVDTNMDNRLGRGSSGTVVQGYFGERANTLAAKIFTVLDEKEFTDPPEHEATVLKRLRHENIIKVYDVLRERVRIAGEPHVNIWIMMEYCPLGDLVRYCRETDLNLRQKVQIMLECANGLSHLHDIKRLTHRDVKPQNVLMGGSMQSPVAKLSDFGTAKYLEYNERDKTRSVHSLAGTDSYMAPELHSLSFDDQEPTYDKSVDVFSLGMTYLSLIGAKAGTRMTPYLGEECFGQYNKMISLQSRYRM